MKRILFICSLIFTLFYLFFFPSEAFQATSQGLELWFYTILPSLLPFCILSNLLIASGILPKLLRYFIPFFQTVLGLSVYGTYALLLGLFCGYPMGAKITSDLYRQQKIDLPEANYLLTFVNHPSPMFVISYLSLHLFENGRSLSATFLLLYGSAFLTSILFRIVFHRFSLSKSKTFYPDTTSNISMELIDHAIMDGFETITRLGGYILLFSIISSMIGRICAPFSLLQWLLPGLTEMTTGIARTFQQNLSADAKYILALTFASFGGFSTIAQTKGMLHGTPLSITYYIIGKTITAVFTLILGSLLHIV